MQKYTFLIEKWFGGITITTEPIGENEQMVLEILNKAKRDGKKMRISDLVKLLNKFGSHEEHEYPNTNTTPRKMFQIIRNMREAGVPIVGDKEGLWIASDVSEIERFAQYLEQKAKSDIASMLKLKKTMLSYIQSEATSLFDGLNLEE